MVRGDGGGGIEATARSAPHQDAADFLDILQHAGEVLVVAKRYLKTLGCKECGGRIAGGAAADHSDVLNHKESSSCENICCF